MTPAQSPTTPWSGYSQAERDRRWAAVRQNAARAGFDCTFVPLGNGPDAKYLTQFKTATVLLPTDGREPIVITDEPTGNNWLAETRGCTRAWSQWTIDAIADLGLERARIGVAGLKGGTVTHVRFPDGVVNHTTFAEVVRHFPNATFEDATDVVGFARYVKSDEEIACLGQAAAIAELGIKEASTIARLGLDEAELYARITAKMLELGSEYHPLALYSELLGGPESVRRVNPPIGRRLQANTLLTSEVSAVWGGQIAQEDQPMLIGSVPDAYKPIIELQREVFEAGLERMRPDTAFGEFIAFVNGFGQQRGLMTEIVMHGRGYGDDGPLLSPRARGEDVRDVRIEQGTAWIWKPRAKTADGKIEFQWGGCVVVTDNGGQRLSERPHGMISIS